MQEQANGATRDTTTTKSTIRTTAALETRLAGKVDSARKHRGTVRFFEKRPGLLRSEKHGTWARAALRRAERRLARVTSSIAGLERTLALREGRRRAKLRPRAAICDVFKRHCLQAVSVAWCESRLRTGARNGQYVGLFQMGSHERRVFGHGPTAHDQSRAAYRYFIRSGRDWSPWSCKPWRWE